MESRESRIKRFAGIHSRVRMEANKSQEFMARELGVSKKTVQNWEKGLSSPSFFQSLEWFRVLHINPFPHYLGIISPDTIEGLKPSDSNERIENAFRTLCDNLPISDKRALLYLFYGNHGSSPHSVLQLMLAHLHSPIEFRIMTAYMVANEYELNSKLGTLICADNIQPDMDNLWKAIHSATDSAVNNDFGYTNLKKEFEEEND